MYVERFQLIVPAHKELSQHAVDLSSSTVQAFSGTKAMQNYGINVRGSGASANGEMGPGTITTYDYQAIYNVYNLASSESANYWFVSYHKDTSHSQLEKTFQQEFTTTVPFDVKFTITGNNVGVTSVFLTFNVIRLVVAGVTKDFVCTNPENAGANNQDGSPYQGTFTPR